MPFSLTATMDTNTFAIGYQKDFIFTGITMKSILSYNLGLIFNLVEKKPSLNTSHTYKLLRTNDKKSIFKV